MKSHRQSNNFVRVARKSLLSAFVLLSFGAYALEHRVTSDGSAPASTAPQIAAVFTPPGTDTSAVTDTPALPAEPPPAPPAVASAVTPADTATSPAPAAPTAGVPATDVPATDVPATDVPAATPTSGYKDGTFTGPSVDVQWGLVQVQATIQGGKIGDVRFLQYPKDRRTSARINAQANPWLQQEAIQAQSANVDLISGATLTSEGFAMSLQGALDRARS